MDMEPIIDFENIYVSYGQYTALHGINLKIFPGENWVILGANGSGKSTLLKLFSNDLYPNASYTFQKKIFGKERWDIFELKKLLGIVTNDLQNKFEQRSPLATALDVVLSGYHSSLGIFKHHSFSGEEIKAAYQTMEFLNILQIKNKKVCEMSTGQLRRCIAGRSLIHNPHIFVLDEPTGGLDIKARTDFIKTIQKISKTKSIILITHDVSEIIPEISHAALMLNGTIYSSGKIDEVLTSGNLSRVFNANIKISRSDGKYFATCE